jgi:selenide,water dikinase
LSQSALAQVLRQLPVFRNANVIVNSNTFDDAGVYRLDLSRQESWRRSKANRDRLPGGTLSPIRSKTRRGEFGPKALALVQTVDFFTPIVDDPFAYGQIAAANALSDVFAMGGRPLTALNIMGFPTDLVSPKTVTAILRGGAEKAYEAGCAVIGGHTIRNPEPIYGLAVTGIVDLRRLMTNTNARPGDLLVLTKPLGTGIATTAIKRGVASRALATKVTSLMSKINSVGAELAENNLVRAAADITGFGLLGHLANICRASGVSASVNFARVPVISREIIDLINRDCLPGGTRDNLLAANRVVDWENLNPPEKLLLSDAQTSGGLLLCVNKKRVTKVLQVLKKSHAPSMAAIGEITRRRPHLICTTK